MDSVCACSARQRAILSALAGGAHPGRSRSDGRPSGSCAACCRGRPFPGMRQKPAAAPDQVRYRSRMHTGNRHDCDGGNPDVFLALFLRRLGRGVGHRAGTGAQPGRDNERTPGGNPDVRHRRTGGRHRGKPAGSACRAGRAAGRGRAGHRRLPPFRPTGSGHHHGTGAGRHGVAGRLRGQRAGNGRCTRDRTARRRRCTASRASRSRSGSWPTC